MDDLRARYPNISIATWCDPSLSVHPFRRGPKSSPAVSPLDAFAQQPYVPKYKVRYKTELPQPTDDEDSQDDQDKDRDKLEADERDDTNEPDAPEETRLPKSDEAGASIKEAEIKDEPQVTANQDKNLKQTSASADERAIDSGAAPLEDIAEPIETPPPEAAASAHDNQQTGALPEDAAKEATEAAPPFGGTSAAAVNSRCTADQTTSHPPDTPPELGTSSSEEIQEAPSTAEITSSDLLPCPPTLELDDPVAVPGATIEDMKPTHKLTATLKAGRSSSQAGQSSKTGKTVGRPEERRPDINETFLGPAFAQPTVSGRCSSATESDDHSDERRVSFAPGTPDPKPTVRRKKPGKGKKRKQALRLPPEGMAFADAGAKGAFELQPAPTPPEVVAVESDDVLEESPAVRAFADMSRDPEFGWELPSINEDALHVRVVEEWSGESSADQSQHSNVINAPLRQKERGVPHQNSMHHDGVLPAAEGLDSTKSTRKQATSEDMAAVQVEGTPRPSESGGEIRPGTSNFDFGDKMKERVQDMDHENSIDTVKIPSELPPDVGDTATEAKAQHAIGVGQPAASEAMVSESPIPADHQRDKSNPEAENSQAEWEDSSSERSGPKPQVEASVELVEARSGSRYSDETLMPDAERPDDVPLDDGGEADDIAAREEEDGAADRIRIAPTAEEQANQLQASSLDEAFGAEKLVSDGEGVADQQSTIDKETSTEDGQVLYFRGELTAQPERSGECEFLVSSGLPEESRHELDDVEPSDEAHEDDVPASADRDDEARGEDGAIEDVTAAHSDGEESPPDTAFPEDATVNSDGQTSVNGEMAGCENATDSSTVVDEKQPYKDKDIVLEDDAFEVAIAADQRRPATEEQPAVDERPVTDGCPVTEERPADEGLPTDPERPAKNETSLDETAPAKETRVVDDPESVDEQSLLKAAVAADEVVVDDSPSVALAGRELESADVANESFELETTTNAAVGEFEEVRSPSRASGSDYVQGIPGDRPATPDAVEDRQFRLATPPSPNVSHGSNRSRRYADHWERKHANRPLEHVFEGDAALRRHHGTSEHPQVVHRDAKSRRWSDAAEEEEAHRRRKEAKRAARRERDLRERLEEEERLLALDKRLAEEAQARRLRHEERKAAKQAKQAAEEQRKRDEETEARRLIEEHRAARRARKAAEEERLAEDKRRAAEKMRQRTLEEDEARRRRRERHAANADRDAQGARAAADVLKAPDEMPRSDGNRSGRRQHRNRGDRREGGQGHQQPPRNNDKRSHEHERIDKGAEVPRNRERRYDSPAVSSGTGRKGGKRMTSRDRAQGDENGLRPNEQAASRDQVQDHDRDRGHTRPAPTRDQDRDGGGTRAKPRHREERQPAPEVPAAPEPPRHDSASPAKDGYETVPRERADAPSRSSDSRPGRRHYRHHSSMTDDRRTADDHSGDRPPSKTTRGGKKPSILGRLFGGFR